jgi:hypothetical protein
MRLDLDAVRANAQASSTEDLLDRVTAYRAGMEPEALAVLEEELRRRNVGPGAVADHDTFRRAGGVAGLPRRCRHCPRPAVVVRWVWHRLWGVLPVFPARVPLCADHAGPGRARSGAG